MKKRADQLKAGDILTAATTSRVVVHVDVRGDYVQLMLAYVRPSAASFRVDWSADSMIEVEGVGDDDLRQFLTAARTLYTHVESGLGIGLSPDKIDDLRALIARYEPKPHPTAEELAGALDKLSRGAAKLDDMSDLLVRARNAGML